MIDDFVSDATRRMDKSVEAASHEFNTVRTGRASAALLDRIQVDYYGTPTPLQQLATINVPEPRMLGVPSKVDQTIATVDPGTPAATIVQAGDKIVAVNGQDVTGEQISEKIRASNGDPVSLTVQRGGKELTVQARPRMPELVDRLYKRLNA